MTLTTDTPLADRPKHQASCGLKHDCAGQDCLNGQMLASVELCEQDTAEPWIIRWPMSDQDILDAEQRRIEWEAQQAQAAADAAAKEAEKERIAGALGITLDELKALLS